MKPKKNGRLGSVHFPHILPPLTNHPNPFFVLFVLTFNGKKNKNPTSRGTVAWRIRVPEIPRRPSRCQPPDPPASKEWFGVFFGMDGWSRIFRWRMKNMGHVGCHPGIPKEKKPLFGTGIQDHPGSIRYKIYIFCGMHIVIHMFLGCGMVWCFLGVKMVRILEDLLNRRILAMMNLWIHCLLGGSSHDS